jgi:hypothetical protein
MNLNGEPKRARSLEELPDAALKCHAFGHGWEPMILPDYQFKDGTSSGRVENRCDCGTVRPENVNSDGTSWARSYRYPIDYSFSASKDEYRAEWIRRERVKKTLAIRAKRKRAKQPSE